MPSIRTAAVTASVGLGALKTSLPETVGFTSRVSGASLVGYFSSWTATLSAPSLESGVAVAPLTVFTSKSGQTTCDWVKEKVEGYKAVDDVFDETFLDVVYIKTQNSTVEAGLAACLQETYGTSLVLASAAAGTSDVIPASTSAKIPDGPYLSLIANGDITLAQAYRVHEDDHQAFMNGLLPVNSSTFRYAPVSGAQSHATIGIPVPSRLFHNTSSSPCSTPRKPLSGVRVTIKDIIDIAGVRTTNGNRAWAELYPRLNSSAPSVQALVDLGAVVIGKTKTAQFANSDRVTADWVDYHDGFNPRGDGYQDPGVSSAGAGAATAAYEWVDVSIGTDTGGSVRIPAAKNGLFAIRPSFGAVSNEGVMPEGEFFDSVGFLTRSPRTLQSFGKAWLAKTAEQAGQIALPTNHTAFPKQLILPSNLWPAAGNASQAVFEEWIGKLAATLNATVVTTPIDEFWNATAHVDRPGTDFFEYMRNVAFNLNWKHQLEVVITPFREAYAKVFAGRKPFINPFPAARYVSAENVTDEMVAESYDRFEFFRDWFGREVVRSSPTSCSESLFLFPMFSGADELSYRNTVYSPPDVSTWQSFLKYYYSVQSQGPEVVFPIGQTGYVSDVSGVEEQLPVAIDVLAHRGCDMMLLDLAGHLADEGLLGEVKTGRTAF